METVNYHNIGTSTDWIVIVVYFLAVMLFGSYFSKYNRNTKDFFFGGRRFSWWLIAFSIVATGVGSHSFVKYSAMGFEHGLSSTMTYLNDWFFVPFFLFGWLPIVVYSKIRSIPEYFEKRFTPLARHLATILLLFYMIGYIGIGFLTLGKAAVPLLPESFTLFGMEFQITLMGIVIFIAVITGIYITFGGQTAVIFTDLLQGFILLFAGLLLFFLGVSYIGGFDIFWNLLPVEWKLPLAKFNSPPDFNFVGIFWQDGVAGSVGFLFMNMGLIMRFMATKSVNEGRKAAVFNILFMLPISAIVVGNAGWIGKAISVENPGLVDPATNPDQIFVVVANIVSQPGVFGFIMAALTAALMSTVDTLINATSAIYMFDIHTPLKKHLSKHFGIKEESSTGHELSIARISSVVITLLGIAAVLVFKDFPTVYEAHGYFHSTLTPPLVVTIFFGAFWKKFNASAVITTLIGGVTLMILGNRFPALLIGPFDHGTSMDTTQPYIYIQALYNTFVCAAVAVAAVYTTNLFQKASVKIQELRSAKNIFTILILLSVFLLIFLLIGIGPLELQLTETIVLILIVPVLNFRYINYNEEEKTTGLTVWSIQKAKEMFKGSKINDAEGEKITVEWKLKEGNEDVINFSNRDMLRMKANPGDLVYICDTRKIFGGLKSTHTVFGEPHNEDGIVYINNEHVLNGQFVKGRKLTAEKEM